MLLLDGPLGLIHLLSSLMSLHSPTSLLVPEPFIKEVGVNAGRILWMFPCDLACIEWLMGTNISLKLARFFFIFLIICMIIMNKPHEFCLKVGNSAAYEMKKLLKNCVVNYYHNN